MRLFVAAVVAFALVLAGCGSSAKPHLAAPQPSQADRMKAVVRVWTANLNAGNNAAEARLFSLPALISSLGGPYGCTCTSPAEVVQSMRAGVFRPDRVDRGTSAVRYGGAQSSGRPGNLEVRLAGFAHRGAVHDRARQDHS